MTSFVQDWAELPPELLDFIVTKLGRLSDYIRFCGVCPKWRIVALSSDNVHKQSMILLKLSRKKLPMLMIKTQEHDDEQRGLFCISNGMTYNIKLPQPCNRRFFGSSHGWLMYFEESRVVTLLNPLTGSCISLPIFEDSCFVYWRNSNSSYYLVKGILSADPTICPGNYMVAVIYNVGDCKLAVYKSGDMHWSFITVEPNNKYLFSDIAFHKGNLYGVTFFSKLVQIDISNRNVKTIIHLDFCCRVVYLVESQGELLMVQRRGFVLDKEEYEELTSDEDDDEVFQSITKTSYATTLNFKVFRMVHDKDSKKWVQISTIGEQAFFVGGNSSLCVSTIEFPECMSNSIYYNSQYYLDSPPYECRGPDEDSGFFRLDDESFHSHHLLDTFEWHMEPPIWFVPHLD